MTKNVWVQPQTAVQQFVDHVDVSASGDHDGNYLFTVNAGDGGDDRVYQETKGRPGRRSG